MTRVTPRAVRASLMDITAHPDLSFLRGKGSWLWDDRGRRYLDFVQGWAKSGCSRVSASR